MLTDRQMVLLEERGIDAELASRLGVTACDRLGPDGVSIPFVLDGQVVNHKHRTILSSRKRCFMDDGGAMCLWNADVLTDQSLANRPLIITEGEFDALIAMSAGYQRVVSVPNGAPSSPRGGYDGAAQYQFLDRHMAQLREVKEIILAVDGDEAGSNLLHDLALRFGRPKCRWLKYPVGKDIGDVWAAASDYGDVVRLIDGAAWLELDGIYVLDDLPIEPMPIPYRTGFAALDDHYRVRLGDLCVVTGIPAHGKTTWLNDLACRLAEQHGWRIALASFEQSQASLLKHLRRWRGGDHDAWIRDHFVFIKPANLEEGHDLKWLHERILAAVIRHDIKVAIIDPWNEIEHRRGSDSEAEYLNAALRECRWIAERYRIHVIIVAHPTKLRREANGNYPMPSLYDVAGAAAWANKPDVGIVIHREGGGDTIIKIAKSRYHDEIGKPGEIRMFYDWGTGRYQPRDDLQ